MTDTLKIRELNDAFRRCQSGPGKVLLSPGINALSEVDQIVILAKVVSFDDFSKDNDPHGEHDCGFFDHAGDRILWRIGYYDLPTDCGSEDSFDPATATRVLTVMLAEEY